MTECKDAEIRWYETLSTILVISAFVIMLLTMPISISLAKSYTDGIDPKEGDRPVSMETGGLTKYREISPRVLVDAVNKQRELPEGVKTLISEGTTDIDENRLYLTPESIARFLSSNESLKSAKDKVLLGGSPVLTEIPLEPENPDSATFWLYYGENDGFYINHSELPANTLWEDVSGTVESAIGKAHRVGVFTGAFLLIGIVMPTMAIGVHLTKKENELRYGKNV